MSLLIQQLVNGLALGSVYVLMAIGFTLIFGVLRLLNMAHGELYMLGAYLAYTGIAILGLSPWLAIPGAIATVFVLAGVIERIAFRPLRDSPHFIPLVSTIAVSTIILESIRNLYGPYMFGLEALLPIKLIDLGPVRIQPMQILLIGSGTALTIALQVFLGRTQLGKAVRATSQDLIACRVLGLNVDRIIALTFAIGSALGAVAGILVSMYVGAIFPDMGYVALFKAFTAAVLGGMGNVKGAVIGGVVLGLVESLGSAYLPSGFSDALPYLMLFGVLLLFPGGLLRTAASNEASHTAHPVGEGLLHRLAHKRIPDVHPAAVAVVAALVALCVAPFLQDYVLRILFTVAIYAFMALGTNVVLGLAGQLSLSHAAFFAIGAYASAILATKANFDPWPAMLAGVVIAVILGYAISFVTFRVKGYYLALVTLAFAETVRVVLSFWIDLTRGMMGIRGIPPLRLGSIAIDTPLRFFDLSVVLLAVGIAAYTLIAYSHVGRALLAMRDDEVAARSIGLRANRLKTFAFVVSAVFPALGGSVLAHYYTAITPDFAQLGETVTALVIVVIGGLGSAAGAVFGSAIVNILPELFRAFGDYRLLIYGIIILVVILFQPQGMFSIGRRLARSG
jgi:branched-chain amino acid transport system permease protein